MFGLDLGELIILALAALVLLRPQDLPKAARKAGRMVGKVKEYWASLTREFSDEIESLQRLEEEQEAGKRLPPPSTESPVKPPLPRAGLHGGGGGEPMGEKPTEEEKGKP